ncbi:MAG TPA: hypothetical protein GXZ74_05990 [Tissierellia bacterium]|nr:hypothetical protein [Tissierellia bacterium]
MRRNDIYWLLALGAFLFVMLSPWTSATFSSLTADHPYLMGFIKFFFLASLGELFAIRLNRGDYHLPPYLLIRAIIWGIVGLMVVYTFTLYSGGVSALMAAKMLPNGGRFFHALMTSASMNLTFAPAFMAAHRISDRVLDRRAEARFGVRAAISDIDWTNFYSFVLGKTVPFFWIPAHTITFLLPLTYRVLVAAMLSIALGLILSLAKATKKEKTV